MSTANSAPADGGQKRDLVAVLRHEGPLVGEDGAVDRQLDLFAFERVAEIARQRFDQRAPVERRLDLALGRAGEVGELAEEDQPDRPRQPPVSDMCRGWAGAAPRSMAKWCRSGLIRIASSSAAASIRSGASDRSAARKSTFSAPPRQA